MLILYNHLVKQIACVVPMYQENLKARGEKIKGECILLEYNLELRIWGKASYYFFNNKYRYTMGKNAAFT